MNIRYISTTAPTLDEVRRAVKSLMNNKAAGQDELLNYAPGLIPYIHEGTIVTKGDLSHCRNWRGITLLNTIQKVVAFIILDRMSDTLELTALRREQAGFRANRTIFIAFVDFEHAFDTINRGSYLEMSTEHILIPDRLIAIIRSLYRDALCRVRFRGKESEPFEMEYEINGQLQDDICLISYTISGIQSKISKLEANALTNVEEFRYLGSSINKYIGADADVKSRISKARHAYTSLSRIWQSLHRS
ncbi:hypothetical protein CVS40_5456 [Lucilia cuprina]|nr:hypothetical protein CVS40_5456 [Lucilia cuprina]